MTPKRYPLPGFPRIGPATIEDWLLIDGNWHNVVYVFDGADTMPFPTVYIDGRTVDGRAQYAFFDRVLSPAEIDTFYQHGRPTRP